MARTSTIVGGGGGASPSIGGPITGGTTGSVLFVGPGALFAQDNANFFWDNTNNFLGIGTATPGAKLETLETVANTRLSGIYSTYSLTSAATSTSSVKGLYTGSGSGIGANTIGVLGGHSGFGTGNNIGIWGESSGTGTGTNIGLFGTATAAGGVNLAGYFDVGDVFVQNNISLHYLDNTIPALSTSYDVSLAIHPTTLAAGTWLDTSDAFGAGSATSHSIYGGTLAAKTAAAPGTVAQIAGLAYATTEYDIVARITYSLDTAGPTSGSMTLDTKDTGDFAALPRVTINPNGNVGIGISTAFSALHVNGSISVKRTAVVANYTVLLTDYYIGCTANGITIDLPTVANAGEGKVYVFKDESGTASGGSPIVLQPNGVETIDGASNYLITSPYESITLLCNGTEWSIT